MSVVRSPTLGGRIVRFMHDFRRLEVWRRARDLVVAIDHVTRQFPRSDRGLLAAQLRRSALSIPSNISEGCGKSSRKDTIRYFGMAASSATETESHIEVATALRFITAAKRDALVGDVQVIQRMLFRLMRNIP
jgi:four helix bundle protein